ncbi:hypothetical protein IAE35_08100 [Pseudomonas sp. S75]|uniref:PA0061/PA0062 family lipoprotein n=1 Tax=unclassified Pseudomonas TaxID=196821 RepID=UPI0019069363|nr:MULTISPECIES: hypothetical protein [unclassified Pseudomonas]MBJ9974522.1 hypothetical protein [Pseudomonas sp. S30]MBK0153301.1 hypothetical protein [Pseudomonas sp. S75]
MRTLLALGACALLAACSTLPDPDPSQAWVDLAPGDATSLHAVQVDERDWADERYFEVPPGNHELTVRYRFPVAPSNIGAVDEPLWRDCQLNLSFKDFNAGQRYSLQAGTIGFRPWVKLYDEQRKLMSQGEPAGCQHS